VDVDGLFFFAPEVRKGRRDGRRDGNVSECDRVSFY